jgi:hypothetical protein
MSVKVAESDAEIESCFAVMSLLRLHSQRETSASQSPDNCVMAVMRADIPTARITSHSGTWVRDDLPQQLHDSQPEIAVAAILCDGDVPTVADL